jgi:RNA polymerase sigma factor (sigma-70 family)
MFALVEREIAKAESSATTLKPPEHSGPAKNRLNNLYAIWTQTKSEEALDELLTDVELYARRVLLGKGGKLSLQLSWSPTMFHPTETSVQTQLNVWRNLDSFVPRCRFSTWVHQIALNTAKDLCRSVCRRNETGYLSWKGYDGDYAGSSGSRGTSGAGPYSFESGDGGGAGYHPLPHVYEDSETDERTIRLDKLATKLRLNDRTILKMYRAEQTPAEIGVRFKKDAKWASNQLNRIKSTLRDLANTEPSNVRVLQGHNALVAFSEAA